MINEGKQGGVLLSPSHPCIKFFGTGLVYSDQPVTDSLSLGAMDVIQNVIISEKGEQTSSTKSSRLVIRLSDKTTKGGFFGILNRIGDYRLLVSFLETQRARLKIRGLHGQFLKMGTSELHTLMKLGLNNYSDWDRWLAKLLEVTLGSMM